MHNLNGLKKSPYLPSNNAKEECIKVCKVYDWVVLSESKNECFRDLPEPCVAAILSAIEDNQEVTVQCTIVGAPSSEASCPPCNQQAATPGENAPTCKAVILDQDVKVHGANHAANVKLIQWVTVRLEFFRRVLGVNVPIVACDDEYPPGNLPIGITRTLCLTEKTLLCLPKPLNADNISCRLFNVKCDEASLHVNNGNVDVNVCVSLCKDVQVECEVKLEVIGKFCQPRLPIKPPVTPCPTAFEFPPQCDFFPEENCTCQALVWAESENIEITEGTNGTTATGTSKLIAKICPNCTLSQSSLLWKFTEMYPSSDTIKFDASEIRGTGSFNYPECMFDPMTATNMLTVTGSGTLNGVANKPFELVLTQVGTVCTYTLTINPMTMDQITVTVTSDPLAIMNVDLDLCDQFEITDCVKLDEF